MTVLSIDIETYCDLDLPTVGVYAYAEHPSFEIMLFGYSLDGGPVEVLDLTDLEEIPPGVLLALGNSTSIKTAWNMAFERNCLAAVGIEMPLTSISCSMVQAASLGLPMKLDTCAKVLKVSEKMAEGKALISYFCKPCKPTKANGYRTRNRPEHAPDKWALFKEYNRADVQAEMEIAQKLKRWPIPASEQRLWVLDQQINSRGVLIDTQLVEKALDADTQARALLEDETVKLTGVDNPNSLQQIKEWLGGQDVDAPELTKGAMPALLANAPNEVVSRVLTIRQQLAKTSTKKYVALQRAVCADSRLRGTLQFYGAGTGRWSGRIFQPQNLPKITYSPSALALAREVVKDCTFDEMDFLFDAGNIPSVISQLIRTAIIAKPGHRLLVVDYSQIEAVVLAWLAGEEWLLEEFRGERKVYEATAARMFHTTKDQITKEDPRRQKGKTAFLACGYGGGVNALIKFGADAYMTEEEMVDTVAGFRSAGPEIVKLWRDAENAAKVAIQEKRKAAVNDKLYFEFSAGFMFMVLPSGRRLAYPNARIEAHPTMRSKQTICFEGVNPKTRQWCKELTYSGKLVENACQAIARDIMAEAMLRLDAAGYNLILTVHDEVISEMPNGQGSVAEMIAIMAEPTSWSKDLPLAAAGDEQAYYSK